MEKTAMQAIMSRRSIRKYKPDQITEEQLAAILDAFTWAPTARNEQEVRAIVIQDAELLKSFSADFRAYDAANGGRALNSFYFDAPTLILLCGPADFPFTAIDSGIAVENMAIAAESLGLGTVVLGCIRLFMADAASAEWRAKFGFKDGEIFTIGLAVGTPDCENPKGAPRKDGKIVFIK
ncbi:MAG: nitroreductase family protein [Clostridiales bacterium]|nr:nitroreductase family protein [Clostridiales bacterium]